MTSARDRGLTLGAALLGWALDGFEMGVFPIIAWPALRELLGSQFTEELGRQWMGTLAIAFLLGAALGGVIFGRLGDRIGRVRAMALAVLVYSALTGCSALAQSPSQLAGMRFLAALGMGGEWALGVALVVETWPANARPWLSGLIGAAVSVGYVAVAGFSLLFTQEHSWRTIVAWCAAPALLTFAFRRFVPESEKWRLAVNAGPRPTVSELLRGDLRRRTIAGAVAGAIPLVAIWGAIQFTQPWAASMAKDFDPKAPEKVQIVSASAAAFGAFLTPVFLARRSRRWSYFGLCAAAFVSAEFLFLGHDRFDGRFLVAVGIAGAFTGAFNGFLPLYLPELFPTRLRATGQGACYNVGRILAVFALAIATGPLNVRGDYSRACSYLAAAYAIGLVAAWFLPETCERELE